MFRFIDYAIDHARLTIATLIFLLCAGIVAYRDDPERGRAGRAGADHLRPAVAARHQRRRIPSGCCCEPVETQLKSVGNVKEMRSTAFEGGGFVLLEFEAGFDSKVGARRRARQGRPGQARPAQGRRRAVRCRRSIFRSIRCWWWRWPGDVPERTLLHIARNAKNAIEQAPGVLSAELRGARDEAVEIIAEPMLMKSYGVSLDQFITGFSLLQQPDRGRRARGPRPAASPSRCRA